MQIFGNQYISNLQVKVTFDLSGTVPVINLVNLSTGDDLSGVSYAFTAKAPDTTFIHEGDITNPDVTGIWTTEILADQWPRPFSQIEWSGAPYQFFVVAKDPDGNIFTAPTQYASICRPNGNLPTSKNFYGVGIVNIKVQCDDAYIYFQDLSNTTYKGITGTIGSSVLKVTFPMDATGTQPTPFAINNFSTALVPISFSAKGYQFYYSSTYDYDFGNEVHVILRYVLIDTFDVWCNIDLCPLVCEFVKLIQQVESGSCADSEAAHAKLLLINSKMNILMVGIKEPLCGVDVPALIEEIKTIGGFSCDCCNTNTGIARTTSDVIGGYNFIINPVCGDITGDVETNGNNITFNLQDKKYVFQICEASPPETTAFTVERDEENCQVTYCLKVNMGQLAEDMANTILDSGDLVNLWQSIFVNNPGAFTLIVDGGCIFSSSATCDYSFFGANIPPDTTFALLTSITISGVPHPLSYAFNLTIAGLVGLQTYLNGLGYGTFAVSASEGGVLITSNANPNNIQQITYKISGTTYIADLSKECTGYVPISANEVIQNIINYLCGIDDSKVVTSGDYEICWINPETGLKVITTITAGTELTTLFTTMFEKGCSTIDYIISLNTLNCAAINNIFPVSDTPLQSNDYFYGVKGGICARINPTDAITVMLTLALTNPGALAAFCDLVTACGGGLPCVPYNEVSAELVDFDSDCPEIIGFEYFFADNVLHITKIIFANTPSGSQTISVEYKLDSAGSYTLFDAALAVNADGTINTPPEITMVAGATYNIRLAHDCDSPPASPPNYFIDDVVVPGSVFSGEFRIDNDESDPGICDNESLTLYSAIPYGVGTFMYYDSNLTLPVTGFDFIMSTGSLDIYDLNNATGEVGAFSKSCSVVGNDYVLSNNEGAICFEASQPLYSDVPFGVGAPLYTDVAMTIPASGFAFILDVSTGSIYHMNTINGIVLAATGNTC